jgi:hypothetical protein
VDVSPAWTCPPRGRVPRVWTRPSHRQGHAPTPCTLCTRCTQATWAKTGRHTHRHTRHAHTPMRSSRTRTDTHDTHTRPCAVHAHAHTDTLTQTDRHAHTRAYTRRSPPSSPVAALPAALRPSGAHRARQKVGRRDRRHTRGGGGGLQRTTDRLAASSVCGAVRQSLGLRRSTSIIRFAAQYVNLSVCGAVRQSLGLRRSTSFSRFAAQYVTSSVCGAVRHSQSSRMGSPSRWGARARHITLALAAQTVRGDSVGCPGAVRRHFLQRHAGREHGRQILGKVPVMKLTFLPAGMERCVRIRLG